jgi:hypothetical protein
MTFYKASGSKQLTGEREEDAVRLSSALSFLMEVLVS